MNEEEKKEIERKEAEERAAKEKATADANSNKRKINPVVEEAKKAALDIKAENDRREKILEEEKKILDRKEILFSLGGGSPAGNISDKPKLTNEETASRNKIKELGNATGAEWAKKMNKEDGSP